jgi:hypothetical protein
MADVWALEGGRPETRPTDGKIKAPTWVGRMWLVVLGFLAIFVKERLALLAISPAIPRIQAPSQLPFPRRRGDGHA